MKAAPSSLEVDFGPIARLGNRIVRKRNALREVSPANWSESQQSWTIGEHEVVAAGCCRHLPLSTGRHNIVAPILAECGGMSFRVSQELHVRLTPRNSTSTDVVESSLHTLD